MRILTSYRVYGSRCHPPLRENSSKASGQCRFGRAGDRAPPTPGQCSEAGFPRCLSFCVTPRHLPSVPLHERQTPRSRPAPSPTAPVQQAALSRLLLMMKYFRSAKGIQNNTPGTGAATTRGEKEILQIPGKPPGLLAAPPSTSPRCKEHFQTWFYHRDAIFPRSRTLQRY